MTSHSNPQVSHLNLALPQALAQNNSKISSWREWGGVLEALGGVFLGEGQQPVKRVLRGINTRAPPKLAVDVQNK
jgi:hypothetical protein